MDSPYRFGHLSAPAAPRYDYRPHPLFLDGDDRHRRHLSPPPLPPTSHQYNYHRSALDDRHIVYDAHSTIPRHLFGGSYAPRRLNPSPLDFDSPHRHQESRFHEDASRSSASFHTPRPPHHYIPIDGVGRHPQIHGSSELPQSKLNGVAQHLHSVPLPRPRPNEEPLAPPHWPDRHSLPRLGSMVCKEVPNDMCVIDRRKRSLRNEDSYIENLQWNYNTRHLSPPRTVAQERHGVSVWDRIEDRIDENPPYLSPAVKYLPARNPIDEKPPSLSPATKYLPVWDRIEEKSPYLPPVIKYLPAAENTPETDRLDISTKLSGLVANTMVPLIPTEPATGFESSPTTANGTQKSSKKKRKVAEMREKVVVEITPSVSKPSGDAVPQPCNKRKVSEKREKVAALSDKREKVVVQITPFVSEPADDDAPKPCPTRSSKDICSVEIAGAKVPETSTKGESNGSEQHNRDVTIRKPDIHNIDNKCFGTSSEVGMSGKPRVVTVGHESFEDIEEGEFVELQDSASVSNLNHSVSNVKASNDTDSCTNKIDALEKSNDAAILGSIDTNCIQADTHNSNDVNQVQSNGVIQHHLNPLVPDICILKGSNPCMYDAQLSDSLVDPTKHNSLAGTMDEACTRLHTSTVQCCTENLASYSEIMNNSGFPFSTMDFTGRTHMDNYAPIGHDESLSYSRNQLAVNLDSETKAATENVGLYGDSTQVVQLQYTASSEAKSTQSDLFEISREKGINSVEKQLNIAVDANTEKVALYERSKSMDAHIGTQVENMSGPLSLEVKDFDGACSVQSLHDDKGYSGCKDTHNVGEGTNDHAFLFSQCPSSFRTGQDKHIDKVLVSHKSKFEKLSTADGSEKQKHQNLVAMDRVPTSRKITLRPRNQNPLSIISSTGGSKEVVHGDFSLRHRTWKRSNNSWQRSNNNSYLPELHCNRQNKAAFISHKQSPKKSKFAVSSYVRKGHSLIRKPAPGQTTIARKTTNGVENFVQPSLVSLASGRSDIIAKPSFKVFESRKNDVDDRQKISNSSFEQSTLGILPNPTVRATLDDSGEIFGTPEFEARDENQLMECENQHAELISAAANRQSFSASEKQVPFDMKKMTYLRLKSNQLVASATLPSDNSLISSMEKDIRLPSTYYKKKNNQLILDTSSACPSKEEAVVPIGHSNSDDQRISGRSPSECRSRNHSKRRADNVVRKARKHSRFSHVWTLSGEGIRGKSVKLLNNQQFLQSLFPWKRLSDWNRSVSAGKRSLSLIRRKLQLATKRKTIYRVSTDGFSLHKAGVLGIGGSSLKWSKSIDRHSKKANEEATLAVAEVERKKREGKQAAPVVNKKNGKRLRRERVFRVGTARYKMDASRRTLTLINDDQSTCLDQQSECEHRDSVIPSRLLIDNDEYIRVGNGNKLIRDPKKLKRMLASEKIRWSLHTARLRLVKKQQYCQFFTRFGKCNKNGGKCPYMHDPTKVAICTKFLRGTCSDVDCKLTHEILPERMQDCSYFLQGLCTNISCPYRHVKVNSKASVCEGFLRGFCAEGDECRKKHSYACPIFEATGKCLQGSACKLRHPKRTSKVKNLYRKANQNASGRYFGSCTTEISNPILPASRHLAEDDGDIFCSDGRFTEYISLDVVNTDDELAQIDKNEPQHDQNLPELQPDYISLDPVTDDELVQMDVDQSELDQNLTELTPDELDNLIKPFHIMNKGISTSFFASGKF